MLQGLVPRSPWLLNRPHMPRKSPRCKQSRVAMETSSSTFNVAVYKEGNYFLLYICVVYNSSNVAPSSQVGQLLVINDQVDIFICF